MQTHVKFHDEATLHRPGQCPPPWFHLNQQVYGLSMFRNKVKRDCPVCHGKGDVEVVGSDLRAHCPNDSCNWGTVFLKETEINRDIRILTIGQVRTELTDVSEDLPVSDFKTVQRKVSYMCVETGVGSGTVWPEGRLFHTYEEAVDCARDHGCTI